MMWRRLASATAQLAGGIAAAVIFGYLAAVIFKPKEKK